MSVSGLPGALPLLQGLSPNVASSSNATSGSNTSSASGSFASFLGNALSQANQLSNQADTLAATYAAGGPVSVDQLMVAESQASLALDLVVQVRDRVVSAYQTIMNMQI